MILAIDLHSCAVNFRQSIGFQIDVDSEDGDAHGWLDGLAFALMFWWLCSLSAYQLA